MNSYPFSRFSERRVAAEPTGSVPVNAPLFQWTTMHLCKLASKPASRSDGIPRVSKCTQLLALLFWTTLTLPTQ